MKAIVYEKYGLPDVLQLKEVAKPAPKDDEVLVKVHAASVNDWDWGLLRGKPFVNRLMAGFPKPKKIKIPGCDIAGSVEAVGSKVKRLKAGDEVFGDISRCHFGGFAEYVCAREEALTLKPAGMTFDEAAALPQAGILALQGLRHKGHIQPGQKVLINGAGGGAGTFAIQIAKSLGLHVTAVDSTIKLEKMRSLGAEHVIDYTEEDFTKNGQHYDLIIDMMGFHPFFDYRRSLSPKGRYVLVGGSSRLCNEVVFLGPWFSMTGSKKMGLLLHKANKELEDLIALFEAGKVKPVIDRRYPLSEVPEAMRHFGSGKVVGKLVITVA
ncbi:MAG: NAD(P)-dependent alcohol dehydrogenase [Deltaproteobacteria bacterium]|nr:NAD(P)-dependent alcohol dehydrogenase [Deltaproteobacteria bacterium]